MQVTPVPAVHVLRDRERQIETPAFEADSASASGGNFAEMPMVHTHVASAALRESYHGAHAEYATQLLAGGDPYGRTPLDQQLHAQQYASATAYEEDERSYTISLSA